MSPSITFVDFFSAVWGYDPFPWQIDFAERLCRGDAPDHVTVPTGSGKTACLDAAVYALAHQASLAPPERTLGRRIVFIVNRRVIVDEAYRRAGELAQHLIDAAPDSPVGEVARALRKLAAADSGDQPPLVRYSSSGGVFIETAGGVVRSCSP